MYFRDYRMMVTYETILLILLICRALAEPADKLLVLFETIITRN